MMEYGITNFLVRLVEVYQAIDSFKGQAIYNIWQCQANYDLSQEYYCYQK